MNQEKRRYYACAFLLFIYSLEYKLYSTASAGFSISFFSGRMRYISHHKSPEEKIPGLTYRKILCYFIFYL
ncbi:MAG TPA: hypothetical protein DC053_13990 [Lachnoclostridium sp.]|nr:hypothetical protein [Lachnoclostridium sp.]